MLRAREVSAAELLATHLDRLETVNPLVNAVVRLAPDALDRATAADQALARGEEPGPLHGVPFTTKDNFETRGVVTAIGVPERAGTVPPADATAVAWLRAAGRILLGKTNCPPWGGGLETDNPLDGRTDNPYDRSRTPGGSSGGEAAAVAAALSPCGLGTDSGGSLRVPAHFCGVATLKPTNGLVPVTGVLDDDGPIGALSDPRTQPGPIARSSRTGPAMGCWRERRPRRRVAPVPPGARPRSGERPAGGGPHGAGRPARPGDHRHVTRGRRGPRQPGAPSRGSATRQRPRLPSRSAFRTAPGESSQEPYRLRAMGPPTEPSWRWMASGKRSHPGLRLPGPAPRRHRDPRAARRGPLDHPVEHGRLALRGGPLRHLRRGPAHRRPGGGASLARRSRPGPGRPARGPPWAAGGPRRVSYQPSSSRRSSSMPK